MQLFSNWMGKVTPTLLEETTTVNGTGSSSGDNEVVATPGAGYRLVVTTFVMQNESASATTLILRSGTSSTNGWRILGQNQGDGLAMALPLGDPWRLGEDEALNLNLSGANQCGYSVRYYTESV